MKKLIKNKKILNLFVFRGEWTPNEDMNLLINVLKYKKRWCLVAKELNNRSQHSLKNRFFHLISINLNITNKSCLKRKNLNSDIVKILAKKHNYHFPIESSFTKNLKKRKNFPKIKKNSEENLNKMKTFENPSKISPEKTLLLDNIKNNEEIFEKIEEKSLKIENNGFQSNLINQNNYGYNTPFFPNPFFLNQQIQAFYTHNIIQNQYLANYQNLFMNPFNRLNWKN